MWGASQPPPPPPPTALDSVLAVCDDCHLTADALLLALVLCGVFANPLWRIICFTLAYAVAVPYVVEAKDGVCPVAWYVWIAFFFACFRAPVLSWLNSVHRRQPIGGAVFVTGADSGMGHWTASKLAASGFDVFAGLYSPDSQKALEAKVKSDGGDAALARLTCVPLDVTKDESVAAAAAEVKASAKPVVGVICCAGMGYTGPAEYFPIDLYKACWDINFLGYVRVVQAFLPLLRAASQKPNARRGRIVCIGTGGGRYSPSPPMISAYMASKWSAEAYIHTLRFELQLRNLNIDACMLNPGGTRRNEHLPTRPTAAVTPCLPFSSTCRLFSRSCVGTIKPTALASVGLKLAERMWNSCVPAAKEEYGALLTKLIQHQSDEVRAQSFAFLGRNASSRMLSQRCSLRCSRAPLPSLPS